jgi:hypothetical protein
MKTTQSNSSYDLRFTIYERLAVGRLILLSLLLLGFSPSLHAAGPPEAMTFQGFLVDGNGNPLAMSNPANYPVILRIYGVATGGSSLWSEQQIVTVDKGNFSVILSEGTLVSAEPKPLLSTVLAANGADRYVQITVAVNGAPLDMLPRLRLLPSPYAFLSTSANQLVNPAGAAVVTYANSRVEVAGNIVASGQILGNGIGLTNLSAAAIPSLDASKITGTLLDARLSANVPRLSLDNAFGADLTTVGNIGIGAGTANATFPLTIGNNLFGDKISLYGQSGNSYGFGLQSGLLQIHSDAGNSDIGFGYGSSAAMTETMRIKGNGNVGIGTNNPTAKLEVHGGVKITGSNTLEFGGGVAGKQSNAGKIGYGAFTPNTLDIIGAGNTTADRKVKITAEGGTDFAGPVSFNGEKPFQFAAIGGVTPTGNIYYTPTGVPTNQYYVAIVGASATGGEIVESIAVVTNGVWNIQYELRNTTGSSMTWRIMYMRIAWGLVSDNSPMLPAHGP